MRQPQVQQDWPELAALRRAWSGYPPAPDLRHLLKGEVLEDARRVASLVALDLEQRRRLNLPADFDHYRQVLPPAQLAAGAPAAGEIIRMAVWRGAEPQSLLRMLGESYASDIRRAEIAYSAMPSSLAATAGATASSLSQATPPAAEPSAGAGAPGGPAGEAPPSAAGALPPRLGHYELLEEIGRGGMGVVYKARDDRLDRIVALKMITMGPLASTSLIARFYREAQAAAQLNHPHIVPVHDFGCENGYHYFAMGYVEGRSLADRLTEGVVAPRHAAELICKVSGAIAYAHAQGVIHRDLKPGNIMIDRRGEVLVTDFGLAMRLGEDDHLTHTGDVMGTPAYMAPEQARGETQRVGAAADVYALGSLMYHMLTGRAPFQAASRHETIRQVIEEDLVPPRRLNPAVDRQLDLICCTALQKEPRHRFPSAQAMGDDLDRYLRGEPIRVRSVSLWERFKLWVRRPERIRDAGAYAMFLSIVLTIWVLHGIGAILIGWPRPLGPEAIWNLVLTGAFFFFPCLLTGWWVMQKRLTGIVTGLLLWSTILGGTTTFLLGVERFFIVSASMGGVYDSPVVYAPTFTLVGILALLACIGHVLALIAYRANRERLQRLQSTRRTR